MGYAIHVQEVTVFVATCGESECEGWHGPDRGSHDYAQLDANEHWQEHSRRRLAEWAAEDRGVDDFDELTRISAGKAQPPLRAGDRVRLDDGSKGTIVRCVGGNIWDVDLDGGHGVQDRDGGGLVWLSDGSDRR